MGIAEARAAGPKRKRSKRNGYATRRGVRAARQGCSEVRAAGPDPSHVAGDTSLHARPVRARHSADPHADESPPARVLGGSQPSPSAASAAGSAAAWHPAQALPAGRHRGRRRWAHPRGHGYGPLLLPSYMAGVAAMFSTKDAHGTWSLCGRPSRLGQAQEAAPASRARPCWRSWTGDGS
ncbi:hypothetical protein HYH02_014458 [Chlamydomonas schloesseri]|uniref:Uncharacterized protein n=1 Tax=Chlamydomonas schloesseri TaxID=2026947 RepID=A0A835VWU5_9CHLO|nr:hypothetical protein HYH02_014458 [Chlamydomonas schloesseri]|eukprot:KAG2428066.1 hypothetical protein HYH02_014458 [Chlamydomonas schloesseri]